MKVKNFSENYLSEFVYGAIDGIVTTFAIVAASAAVGVETGIILVLGFANVLADGISMGVSDYLSNRSESDQYHKKRRVVVSLLRNNIDKAGQTIQKHLHKYGFRGENLRHGVDTIKNSPHADTFLMKEEYNMADEDSSPVKDALVTFFAFILVGSIPMTAYLFDFISDGPQKNLFLQTSVLVIAAFIGIGWLKSRVAHAPLVKSILETLILGALAAGAAYSVGAWLEPLFVR